MLTSYTGSCHCGAVTFVAELDLTQSTYRCNCSICRQSRFWPAVARDGQFRLLSGEAELTRYTFGRHKNEHYFCKHCGIRLFGIGTDTPVGRMYGVNVGCLGLDDAQLAALPITYVDGLHDRFAPPALTSFL